MWFCTKLSVVILAVAIRLTDQEGKVILFHLTLFKYGFTLTGGRKLLYTEQR